MLLTALPVGVSYAGSGLRGRMQIGIAAGQLGVGEHALRPWSPRPEDLSPSW